MRIQKYYWLVVLKIAGVITVLVAAFAAMGLWRAQNEQAACFERALRSAAPYYESWIGAADDATAYAEIEAIAFVLKKRMRADAGVKAYQLTPTCAPNLWYGFWRELRALNVRQVIDKWKVPDDDITRIARNALSGSYRHLDTWRYRCATVYATTLDVPPTWYDDSLVEVLPPIGRIHLYGPKGQCGG